jgi:hypothetical protein
MNNYLQVWFYTFYLRFAVVSKQSLYYLLYFLKHFALNPTDKGWLLSEQIEQRTSYLPLFTRQKLTKSDKKVHTVIRKTHWKVCTKLGQRSIIYASRNFCNFLTKFFLGKELLANWMAIERSSKLIFLVLRKSSLDCHAKKHHKSTVMYEGKQFFNF